MGDFVCFVEGDFYVGQILQFDGDVFEDVVWLGVFVQVYDEVVGDVGVVGMGYQVGQLVDQVFGKVGDFVGGKVFQVVNVDYCFDDGCVGLYVGIVQILDFQYFNVFFVYRLVMGV